MLSRKTIALNINNLSDARYFAAYDVDIMGYSLLGEGDNLGLIKEIIEWVEGPVNYLQLESWDMDLARFALQETKASGLIVNIEDETFAKEVTTNVIVISDQIARGLESGFEAIVTVDMKSLEDISEDQPFFILPQSMTLTEIEQCINEYPKHGFVFVGGEEEKVGFKSFEDQDEYIELLMD